MIFPMRRLARQRSQLLEIKKRAVRAILPKWDHISDSYLSVVTSFGSYCMGRHICEFCKKVGLDPGCSRILIVGATGGRDYHWLKGFGYEVDVLDLGHHPWNKSDYVGDACSAETWSRISVKYDLVIMCEVLEHLPEDYAALVHVRAALKNGGHIFLSVPYAHHAEPTHVQAYTQTTLTRLLTLAGYETIWWLARPGVLETTLTPIANAAVALLMLSPERGAKVLHRLLRMEFATNERTRGIYAHFGLSQVKGTLLAARALPAPTLNYVSMNHDTFIAPTIQENES